MFENYIRNTITEGYNIMCSITAHDKLIPACAYDESSGEGREIPNNATTAGL